MRRPGAGIACAFLAALAGSSCRAPAVAPAPAGRSGSALSRAVRFLVQSQLTKDDEARDPALWAGGWRASLSARGAGVAAAFSDVASAPAAYAHHALLAVEAAAGRANLDDEDRLLAGRARRAAGTFLQRFAVPDPATGAVAYGWWPPARAVLDTPARRLLSRAFVAQVGGPEFGGALAPWTAPFFPESLRTWPDLDSTALALSALVPAARRDGTPVPGEGFDRLAAAARDVGAEPLRFPSWLSPGSGAYLTWIVPPEARGRGNDVDAAVNANVLRALGLLGRLDAPGAREATDLALRVVEEGRHRSMEEVSDYYGGGLLFPYLVTLAWREGPVPALAPAVETLVAEVETAAERLDGEAVRWGAGGEEAKETALAVETLALAGRRGALTRGGVEFLRRTQQADGGWPSSLVCFGTTTKGCRFTWRSRALVASIAIEALLVEP